MSDADKTYHFEKELKRLADAAEAVQVDLNQVKMDVAVIKNTRQIVQKQDPVKPAAVGGAVGTVLSGVLAALYEWLKH